LNRQGKGKALEHNAFVQIYHTHHARQSEDLPFWLDLAAQYPKPILELGCGTGRVLLPLIQAGYRVVGLDHDPAMLAELRANIRPDLFSGLNLIQADMSAFNFGCQFGLIILPCNTLSTLEPALRQRMLQLVRQHLRADGCFATSLPNPQVFKDLPAYGEPELEDLFPHPLDGEPVQVSSEWKRTKKHFSLTWHYDHLMPDGTTHRYSATVRHSLAPAKTYLDELEPAGLKVKAVYGDFNGSSFSSEAPHMIVVATPAG
jgi:SAM-dependent methyltransferase